MTDEELKLYQTGFKVALNFLYHHQDKRDQEGFEQFLNQNVTDTNLVQESINLKSTMDGAENCGAGQCPDGHGGCVSCSFDQAFNGSYYKEEATE